MSCSRTSNNVINKTQKRSLRRNEREISFADLLRDNNDLPNHQRNIQILLTEVFKATKNLALPITEGMFNAMPNNYSVRIFQELVTEKKE